MSYSLQLQKERVLACDGVSDQMRAEHKATSTHLLPPSRTFARNSDIHFTVTKQDPAVDVAVSTGHVRSCGFRTLEWAKDRYDGSAKLDAPAS